VSVTRARLYSEPVEERIQRSYFVKGDVVGVLSKSESWIKVEYPREGKKSVIGWLKSSDVDDFAPVVKQ